MIKWGVIGLGNMGRVFIEEIQKIENVKLIAIASKTNSKLNYFGEKYKIDKKFRFSQYDDLIKDDNIDAVYISTLNNTHVDLIFKCVSRNKKILCEKPVSLNYSEIYKIKNSISGNVFYEAIAYYSSPQTDDLIKIIKDNEVGTIKKIKTSFGFKVRKVDPASRLFNKKLGGGVILDLACYPLSFLMLFDENVEKYKIVKNNISYALTGVDDQLEAEISMPNNISAEVKISFKQNYLNNCTIEGTDGKIIIPNPWLPKEGSYIEVIKKDRSYKQISKTSRSAYSHQIENVSKAFDKKYNFEKRLFDINKSIKYISILEKLYSK